MFIDASALVAMLTDEDDGTALADRMERAKNRMTSPAAVWETVINVARIFNLPISDVKATVEEFVSASNIQIMSIPPKAGSIAIDAFEKYGKGRHPASLNFGDCMAYACARYYRMPLLFKGHDFTKTDMEPA